MYYHIVVLDKYIYSKLVHIFYLCVFPFRTEERSAIRHTHDATHVKISIWNIHSGQY